MTEREVVDLKEHFEKVFCTWRTEHERRHEMADRTLEERLKKLNEIREMMSDSQKTYVPRLEWEAQHQRVVEDIRSLRESRAEIAGKASMSAVFVGYFFTAGAMLLAIISLVVHWSGK